MRLVLAALSLPVLLLSACSDSLSPDTNSADAAFSASPTTGGPRKESGPTIYAVDDAGRLLDFGAGRPGQVRSRTPITGLAAGESVLGLDIRPATGQLYALGSTSRLYVIDPATAVATPIGAASFTPALSGTVFGFDFNPTVDRIRIVSNTGQNLRAHPTLGTVAFVDGPLAFASTDVNVGRTPAVGAAAYTNSVVGPAPATTTLFVLDAAADVVATQSPPNAGTLNTIGALGRDTGLPAGFDIAFADNSAYAIFTAEPSGRSRLYRIDLATGAATLIGNVSGSGRVVAMAVAQ